MTFSYLMKRAGYHLPLIFGLLTAEDFEILYKRAAIESSYRNAVEFAMARTLDASLFDVDVSVSLIKNPEFLDYQAIATLKAEEAEAEETESREKQEAKTTTTPGLLPGLPAIPTPSVDEKGLAIDTRVLEKDGKEDIVPDQYVIDRVDVAVRLEETLASPTLEQEFTTVIRAVLPGIETCFDCIDFESKPFLLQAIRGEITTLQNDQDNLEGNLDKRLNSSDQSLQGLVENVLNRLADLELTNDNTKFDLLSRLDDFDNSRSRGNQDLQMTLYDRLDELANNVKLRLEKEVLDRDRKSHSADSIMWSNFIDRENDYQRQQDSIMWQLTKERFDVEKKYADDILKFAEEQLERVLTRDDLDNLPTTYDKADLGMQVLGSKDILDYMPWAVSALTLIVLLFVMLRKQKPIYLKPKPVAPAPQQSPSLVEKHMLEEDNDVIRGEIKNLRQAAVAESIREKQGAIEILGNWLDDEAEVGAEESAKASESKAAEKPAPDTGKKGKKKKK